MLGNASLILVATCNRSLLGNGLVNTHSRGNGYADYNRQTVQVCVVCVSFAPGYKDT
jgi:hypothetical protein